MRFSATVDAALLQAVDAFTAAHPEADRGQVLDDALRLWYAREQEHAMADQFRDDSGANTEEWESWRAIRNAAAERVVWSQHGG